MIHEQLTTSDLLPFYIFTNGDPMRHILMVNNGSMLEEGVAKLLAAQKDLNFLSMSLENEEALLHCLDSTHSEVVIISRESSVNLARLFDLLAKIPRFRYLQIVMISADSNIIDVYENQQVYELQGQTLFDFLQGSAFKQ